MTTPQIAARVSSFVADLERLIRSAALETVQAALGGSSTARSAPSSARAPKATTTAKPATSALPRVKKEGRRSPEDVAKVARAIKAHLAEHPGEGVETISKHLGVKSKELALPLGNLLAAKSIRKQGQRRGTRYFVSDKK